MNNTNLLDDQCLRPDSSPPKSLSLTSCGETVGAGAQEASQLCCCQEEQCVICRMEFEVGEDVKVLPCKHLFHPGCVDQWLHINKVTPAEFLPDLCSPIGLPVAGCRSVIYQKPLPG